MIRNVLAYLIAVLFFLFGNGVAQAEDSKCVKCHLEVSPKQVEDFKRGEMAKSLDCTDCHGALHQNETDVEKAQLPTIATCQECHQEEAEQYLSGKHALGLIVLEAMPFTHMQPAPSSRGRKVAADATPWA
jgi:hypothetical protein